MRVLEFTELDAWQACKLSIDIAKAAAFVFKITFENTLCLDTRQLGTVFKKLDTRQSEILTNFLGIACLIPLRTQDICLEISSDCKYCLGLKVEATVEFGHRVKSQCVRHLENMY